MYKMWGGLDSDIPTFQKPAFYERVKQRVRLHRVMTTDFLISVVPFESANVHQVNLFSGLQ